MGKRGTKAASASRGRDTVGLRIIGGKFRGRKLRYSGDLRVRPMKDRVRESLFNILGPAVHGKHAIDLFAGTGALALEALSRGASRATILEQHRPTAAIIRENIATLGVESLCHVEVTDTFAWARRQPDLGNEPWVVFCSPPYAFFIERQDAMLELIGRLLHAAPPESLLVVEADERFDFGLLPDPSAWDLRQYPPAVIGIYEKLTLSPPSPR